MAVFSTFAATVASAGWGAALTTTLVGQLATGVAFNALSSALFQPEEPDRKSSAIIGELRQGVVPRAFGMGRYATKGSLVYHNNYGEGEDGPYEYYVRVTALSDLPVAGLVELWVDDKRCTLDTENPDPLGRGYPIVEYTRDETLTRVVLAEDGRVETQDETVSRVDGFVKFYDGTQTGSDPFLVNYVSTTERPWAGDAVGRGVAYAITTFDYNSDQFRGYPEITFVLDGVPLVGQVTGELGTGDRLMANQAAALIRGFSYGGEHFYGPQIPGDLDLGSWSAAASACADKSYAAGWTDAEKIRAFGTTEVPGRYLSGLEIQVDQPTNEALEDVLSAGNGRIAEVAGRYRIQVGDPPAEPDFYFSDSDVRTDSAEQTFSPFLPLAETVNAVTATYPEPSEAYATQELPPLYVPRYEAEDGNRRLTTTARLRAVSSAEQGERLMQAALDEARRARRVTLTLFPKFWFIEPGDYAGYISNRNHEGLKLYRVDGVKDRPNGDVVVDLTEVDPEDYSWSPGDFTPVNPGSLMEQPRVPPQVPAWGVQGVNADGRPDLFLSWAGRYPRATGIAWQVRNEATRKLIGSVIFDDPSTQGGLSGISNIRPDTLYGARPRVLPNGKWLGTWLTARTPDVRLGPEDIDAAALIAASDAVQEQLAGVREDLEDARSDLRAEFQAADGDLETSIASVNSSLSGFVTTVQTDYATLDNLAGMVTRIEARQAANLVRKIDGVDGVGRWDFTTVDLTQPGFAPSESASLQFVDGAVERPLYKGNANGRTFRAQYWARRIPGSGSGSGGAALRAVIQGSGANPETAVAPVAFGPKATAEFWQKFDVTFTCTVDTEYYGPAWDVDDATTEFSVWGFILEDITEPERAKASVLDEVYVRADVDQAIAAVETTLTAQLGGLQSEVNQNATALSNLDNAIASVETTLTSQIGDLEATAGSHTTTLASHDEALSETALFAETSGGGIAQFRLTSLDQRKSGTQGTIAKLRADLFAFEGERIRSVDFVPPGQPGAKGFEFNRDGTIRGFRVIAGQFLQVGAAGTTELGLNAASKGVVAVNPSGNNETLAITNLEPGMQVVISCGVRLISYTQPNTGGYRRVDIKRDGTTLRSQSRWVGEDAADVFMEMSASFTLTGSGSRTIEIDCPNGSCDILNFYVLVLKR